MACSTALVSLPSNCYTSKGGIVECLIAQYADGIFTVATDPTTQLKSSVSGVSSSTTWYNFAFKKNSCSFTSTLNSDPANGVLFYSTDINLVFNRMETEKRLAVATLAVGEVVCVIKDANGQIWAFGIDEPVTATAGTAESGTASTDGNKYTITLNSNDESLPLPVSAEAYEVIKAHIAND